MNYETMNYRFHSVQIFCSNDSPFFVRFAIRSFIQSNVIFDDANRPLSQTFPIKLDILLTDYAVIWMQVQISILGSHS